MNRKLKSAIRIFKEEGLIEVLKKTAINIKYLFLSSIFLKKEDKLAWKNLNNKYSNNRVFIIGNGPSLNKTELYLLKNEYTMCFNRYYLLDERINWKPNFYCATDDLVLEDLNNELITKISIDTLKFIPAVHFRSNLFKNKFKTVPNIFWLKQRLGENFSKNLPVVYTGHTVLYEGIQILKYLGFNEIYILGIDLNYTTQNNAEKLGGYKLNRSSKEDNDPNHFDPRYFGKDKKFHHVNDKILDKIFERMDYLKKISNELNLKIVNVGIDSQLNSFEFDSIKNVLGISDAMQTQLFNELIVDKTKYNNIDELDNNSSTLENTNQQFEKENFRLSTSLTITDFISKYIIDFLPIGPYCNYIYFVKRTNLKN